MNRSIFVLTLGVGVFALTACSNGFEAVKIDVARSVEHNKSAISYEEWHESDVNPEHLFEKWRTEVTKGQLASEDLCKALNEMDTQHLTLFENELEQTENQEVVKNCLSDLQVRLDNYYINERSALTANLGNFFEDELIHDTSKKATNTNIKAVESTKAGFSFKTVERTIDTRNGFNATEKVNSKRRWVAPGEVVLTFDDGPSRHTETIIKALAEVNAKAMFFHTGKSVRGGAVNAGYLKAAAADGHVMGAHSMTHRELSKLGSSSANQEIYGSLNAIQSVLGWVHPVFRFPYGSSRADLIKSLQQHGVGNFRWDVDSEDWRMAHSNREMLNLTMSQIRKNNGGIVLFHDIHKRTAESLPMFLKTLHDEGYKIAVLRPNDVIRTPISLKQAAKKP